MKSIRVLKAKPQPTTNTTLCQRPMLKRKKPTGRRSNAKLTDFEAEAIRKAYKPRQDGGMRALAKKYSISVASMFDVIHGHSYKTQEAGHGKAA